VGMDGCGEGRGREQGQFGELRSRFTATASPRRLVEMIISN